MIDTAGVSLYRRMGQRPDSPVCGRDFEDDAELRPLGEATHVPDHELDTKRGDRHRGSTRPGSPVDNESTPECRSCGTSVLPGRTKCQFCLSNQVESLNIDSIADETALLHVVHMVVPAASQYAAVAKGTTAASFIPRNDETITSCDLVADLDDEPAQQLVNQWGALPAAVRASAETGQRLVATAHERTPGMDAGQSRGDREDHATFLYDEAGYGIEGDERLTALLEDARDDLWLVPAIVLQRTESGGDENSESQRHHGPKRTNLTCRACDRSTAHQFQSVEKVPDETWSGQPIWECQMCDANR